MNVDLIITIFVGIFGLVTIFLKQHLADKQNKKDAIARQAETNKTLTERDKMISIKLQALEDKTVNMMILLEKLTGDSDFRYDLSNLIRKLFTNTVDVPFDFDTAFRNILMRWSDIIEGLAFRYYDAPSKLKDDDKEFENYLKIFLESKRSEMDFYLKEQVPGVRYIKTGYQKAKFSFPKYLNNYKLYISLHALVNRLANNHLSDDELKKVMARQTKNFINLFVTATNAWQLLDTTDGDI